MKDTDLDIILAIAGCQLTGQEKQDALERVAADPELSTELAAQLAAIEGLEEIGPVAMTASERAALRSTLREQLHLAPAAPATVARPQRRPWWQPVLGLASAAALLVAIVAVPSMLSGSDDSGTDVVAFTQETVAVEETSEADADSATGSSGDTSVTVPELPQAGVAEFFDDTTNANVPTTRTAPIAGTDAGADSTGDSDEAAEDGSVSNDERVEEASPDAAVLGSPFATFQKQDLESCIASLGDELPTGLLIAHAATTTDTGLIVHLGITTADGIEYEASIDLNTCAIVDIDG